MNEHPQQTDRTLRDTRILTLRIWGVVGCIVIAAVIFNLMGILAPVIEFLAVGSIIAFVMSPITNWLEHHGVNRGIGSLVALIVVVAVLVGVVCILSPILFGQIMEVLSRLPEQLRVAGGDLNEMISHAKTLNNTPLKEYLDDNLSSHIAADRARKNRDHKAVRGLLFLTDDCADLVVHAGIIAGKPVSKHQAQEDNKQLRGRIGNEREYTAAKLGGNL